MARGKICTVEQRKVIYELHSSGKNPTKISKLLKVSRKLKYNAIKLVKSNEKYLNEAKKPKARGRKTTQRIDREIVNLSKRDPLKSSTEIARSVNEAYDLNVSSRLIRRRLNENNLFGRSSRKKPMMSEKNIRDRLIFAREHMEKDLTFWKKILWSDETKINRCGSDGRIIVHRPKGQAFNPQYTKRTVKFGGGSIMVWGAFSWYGVGPIVRIEGNMDKIQYLNILRNEMEPYAFNNMPVTFTYMHDNDPKHTAKTVIDWLDAEKINVLKWPAQSPDVNPIEHLWHYVKVAVGQKNYKNFDELWRAIRTAWYEIPIERCRALVESMGRRCLAVIENSGHSTKY